MHNVTEAGNLTAQALNVPSEAWPSRREVLRGDQHQVAAEVIQHHVLKEMHGDATRCRVSARPPVVLQRSPKERRARRWDACSASPTVGVARPAPRPQEHDHFL
jgi:hypothetical protein